jgi:uncharacterized protein (DUF697 family)
MPTSDAPATSGVGAITAGDRAVRLARADTLVKDHMLMSAAVGLIPAPGLDLLAGIGIQLTLLKRLANLYAVPFSESAARGIITSLLGAVGTGGLAAGIFFSALKLLPGVGTLVGAVSMPIAMSAVTYAIGKLFINHFELGGTLRDFDVAANRGYFRELVQRGKHVAAEMTPPRAAAKS